LEERKPRGGTGISGYKITPLFFIYLANCSTDSNDIISFDLDKVQQLNPTITAKMFFNQLKISEVKEYYTELF
jgi:hypothetical protein